MIAALTFLAPGFLWVLVVLPLLWVVPRRVRDVRHGALRLCLLAALVLGLARPVFLGTAEVPRHVIVVDRSASLPEQRLPEVEATLARMLAAVPRGAVRVVVDVAPAARARTLRKGIDEVIHIAAEGRSPLADALAAAAAAIPDGAPGAVALLGDGLATDKGWGPAFADLMARGIPVHTVSVQVDERRARPVGLAFEASILAGHTSRAQVRLCGDAAAVRVTLRSGDRTLATRGGLALEGRLDLVLPFEPPPPGFHAVELVLEVERGARAVADRLTRRIAVQDPLRLLYLGQRQEGGAGKLQQLLGDGFAIVEPGADGKAALDTVDLVMLDDRPARELSEDWQRAIRDAVERRGVGLLASGGRAAFGAGGYHRTEIEAMLPVEFVQKEEKKDPSTTLAVIIDTSGSMVGNRMTLAKQVARLAMRRLQPHDKIGIVEFYGTKSWAAPIQSAANQIDLQRALNRLDASGGTVLMPAIEEAYYAMKNVQTRYKHVLVLTDAGVESGAYESLCRKMADEGMTVSTVLVGPGRHSDFLVDIADWGGGRYYNAADRFNLPELLLKKPSTSVLPSYRPERVDVDRAGGAGWWGDLDLSQLPPVDGFVEAELRPGAAQLMSTRKTKTPLLATRLHGLGRVTALMTEPLGDGTRQWAQWPGYGALLGRVLARTARGHQPPFAYATERRGAQVVVTARRLVREELVPVCQLVDAAGATGADLPLREVAPGFFRFFGSWPPAEALQLIATTRPDRAARTRLVSAARADTAPEVQVDPDAGFPAARAAALSGGRHSAATDASFALGAAPGRAPVSLTPVWPWFALAALLLFVLDVFHRRRATPLEVAA